MHKAKGAAKHAEKAARKTEHAAKKADRARERGGELNPAMTCFGLLAEMGEEFYAHYGTNPNHANAFGKCVSEHAHAKGEDGGGEAEEPTDCEAPAEEPTAVDEEPTDGEEPADEGDCMPTDEEPGECEAPVEEPTAEVGPAELTASEDPDTGDECSPDEEEPESDEGEPEDTKSAAALVLTCFVPAARSNPFALCL